tara:strand:+ start:93 stop:695 length:603 start_codon:yes stop_codon:yes gene_type:complete
MDENHPIQVNALSRFIKPEWHFADIGVAEGEITDMLSPLMSKGYLFEPEPNSFRWLEQKYASSEKLVLNNCAVYSKEGVARFTMNGQWVSGLTGHLQNGYDSGNSIDVKTITLDNYFKDKKINLIKIDVEGAELEVLKGATELMKSQSPIFQVEFHSHEEWSEKNLKFIEDLGYFIYDINFNKVNYKNRPYQAILVKGEL